MNCKGCMTICGTSVKPNDPKKCVGFIPKTNGNLLRSTDDEGIATFMSQEARGCPPSEEDRNTCIRVALQTGILPQGRDACRKCWLKWLGQEGETPSVTASREIGGDTSPSGGGKRAADSRPYEEEESV